MSPVGDVNSLRKRWGLWRALKLALLIWLLKRESRKSAPASPSSEDRQ